MKKNYLDIFTGWSVIAQAIARVLDVYAKFRKFAEYRGMELYVDGSSISVVNPKNGHSSSYELDTVVEQETLWLDRLAMNIEDFTHYELGEAA